MTRLFVTLDEAIGEIKRDLYKSPLVVSHHVQHLEMVQKAHEALDYCYTIAEVPNSTHELAGLAVKHGLWPENLVPQYIDWLETELAVRMRHLPGFISEERHPVLKEMVEGNEPSYTYTDRLKGSLEHMATLLTRDEESRRAFWPIFLDTDVPREIRKTRVPCSLGYQLLIRTVDGQRFLHMTYLQRSCDFNNFWISDVFLARKWQQAICHRLTDVSMGNLTHFITSFHAFIDEEVF